MDTAIRSSCPICRQAGVNHSGAGTNTTEYICPRCGRFLIQALAETQLRNSPPAFPPMPILSGLCRNTWETLGEKILITVDCFKSWAELGKVARIVVPTETNVAQKAEYILTFMRRKTRTFGEAVVFTPTELAIGFCATKNELLFCLRYLSDRGLIEEDIAKPQPNQKGGQNAGRVAYRLTPAGWAALAREEVPSDTSPVAVVAAGAFAEGDPLWSKGFATALQAAGFTAVCADGKTQTGKLGNEMIVALRRATCVIADLTGRSPVALFAAGLAIGAGKPVFWTCEENDARDKKFPLDTRQRIVTTWTHDKLDDFARRLAVCIEAEMGRPRV